MIRSRGIACALACLAAAVTFGGGCSSAPRGEPFRPVFAPPDAGVLFVYRPAGDGFNQPVDVYIDQRIGGALRPGEHLWWAVAPGEVLVRAEARTNAVVRVRTIAGRSAYLEVRGGPPVSIADAGTVEGRERIAETRQSPDRTLPVAAPAAERAP